mmetsp:Transcript_9991/g.13011  ORF Transcript_9991/g.13011 Transcript_9991/m.13011 type:complete len:825 (-) Transcript_9991:428-2902(-)
MKRGRNSSTYVVRLVTAACVLCLCWSRWHKHQECFIQNPTRFSTKSTTSKKAVPTIPTHRQPVNSQKCQQRGYGRSQFEHSVLKMAFKSALTIDDFPRILQAVLTYREMYDSANIPLKYIVPSKEPWAEDLWGMRLGRRVDKIRRQKEEYEKAFPEEFQKLTELGFNWDQEKLEEWDLIYRALKVYKEKEGDCRVPSRFVVPREEPWPEECYELKLGMRIASIRSVGRYVKDQPDRVKMLDDLGFEWRLRVSQMKDEAAIEEYNLVLESLKIYKEENGDLKDLPTNYIVPQKEPWPERCHGLPLGERVSKIRSRNLYIKDNPDRRKELLDLGLSLTKPNTNQATRWNRVLRALTMYQELYGNLQVPQQYVIPHEAPWDEDVWGMRLGNRVNTIRSQQTFIKGEPERQQQLKDLGFEFNAAAARGKRGRKSEADLELEAEIQRNVEMKKMELMDNRPGMAKDELSMTDVQAGTNYDNEVLEKEEEEEIVYPEHSQDLPFPSVADRYRVNPYEEFGVFEGDGWIDCSPGAETDIQAQKDMCRDFREKFWELQGMENACFYDLHYPVYMQKPLRQKKAFEAQKERERTPEYFGRSVGRKPPKGNIMRMDWMSEDEKEAVEESGFLWDEFEDGFTWDEVVDGLAFYKELHQHTDVTPGFTVPYDFSWPRELAGLKLGTIVKGLRTGDCAGKYDAERRKVLDKLKFDFKDEEYDEKYLFFNWNKLITGLYTLKKIKGHLEVDTDFVFPPMEPWPVTLYGLELGKLMNMARWQKYTLWYHYPDRRMRLHEIGFWWGPPVLEEVKAELATHTTIFDKMEKERQHRLETEIM